MSRKECIDLLKNCSNTLKSEYGITSLRLFGSTARDEQKECSDVDVFVETLTPNPFLLMEAKEFLEKSTGRSVDIIRNHRNLNPRLLKEMESMSSEQKSLALDILYDIQSAIERLQERSSRIHDVDDFLGSSDGMILLDATCMLLIAIGESLKNLDKVTEGRLLPTYPSIPWKQVKGMRDIISHHYFDVDPAQVLWIITNGITPLKTAINCFIEKLEAAQ